VGQQANGAPAAPQQVQGERRSQPPGFEVAEGEGVLLSGSVSYQGQVQGKLRVDFLREGGSNEIPAALHTLSLDAPGPWSVEVPEGFGPIGIVAFIDTDQDGPSRNEPKVVLSGTLQVESEPISGIELLIEDDWDRGRPQTGQRPAPPSLRGSTAPPPASPQGETE